MKYFLFPEADILSEYALWWFVLLQFCSPLGLLCCVFVVTLILENIFTILLLIPSKMPYICNETELFQAWAKQQQSQETVSMCTEGDNIWCILLYFFFQDVLIRTWLLPTCSVNKIFGNDHFFFRLHLCFCNSSLVSSRVCLFKNVMDGCKNGEHVCLFAGYWEYRCWSIWSEPFLWTASIGQFRPAELLGFFGIILDLKSLLFSQTSHAPSSLDQCHEVLILSICPVAFCILHCLQYQIAYFISLVLDCVT